MQIDDSNTGACLIWVASDYLADDMYNSYSSGANIDFTMNALSQLAGETSSISIRSKSLDYNYLTISSSQASFIKLVMLAVVPLMFLFLGLEDIIERRRLA